MESLLSTDHRASPPSSSCEENAFRISHPPFIPPVPYPPRCARHFPLEGEGLRYKDILLAHSSGIAPFPHLILVTLTRPVYIATAISFSCFPSFVRSRMVYFPFPSEPAKPSLRKTT